MVQTETMRVTIVDKSGKVERVVESQVGGSAAETSGSTPGSSGSWGSSRIYESAPSTTTEESQAQATEAIALHEAEKAQAIKTYQATPKVKVSGSNLNEAYMLASAQGLHISDATNMDNEIYFYKGSREANRGQVGMIAEVVGERRQRVPVGTNPVTGMWEGDVYNRIREQALVTAGQTGVGVVEDYGFPIQRVIKSTEESQAQAASILSPTGGIQQGTTPDFIAYGTSQGIFNRTQPSTQETFYVQPDFLRFAQAKTAELLAPAVKAATHPAEAFQTFKQQPTTPQTYKQVQPSEVLSAVDYGAGTVPAKRTLSPFGLKTYELTGGLIGTPDYRVLTQEEMNAKGTVYGGGFIPGTGKGNPIKVSGAELYPGEHTEYTPTTTLQKIEYGIEIGTKKIKEFGTKTSKDFVDKLWEERGTTLIDPLISRLPERIRKVYGTAGDIIGGTKKATIQGVIQTPTDIIGLIGTAAKTGRVGFGNLQPEEQMDTIFGGAIIVTEGARIGIPIVKGVLRKIGFEGIRTEEELAMKTLAERQAGKNVLARTTIPFIEKEVVVTGLKGATATRKIVGVVGSVITGGLIGAGGASIITSENPREAGAETISKILTFGMLDVSVREAVKPISPTFKPYGKIKTTRSFTAEEELLKTTKIGEEISAGKLKSTSQQEWRNWLGERAIAKTELEGSTMQMSNKAWQELSGTTKLEYVGKKGTRTIMEVPARVSSVFELTPTSNIAFEEAKGTQPKERYDVFGLTRTSQRIPTEKPEWFMQDLLSTQNIEREQISLFRLSNKEFEKAKLTSQGSLSLGKRTTTKKTPGISQLSYMEKFNLNIGKIQSKKYDMETRALGVSETVRDTEKGYGARRTVWKMMTIQEKQQPRFNYKSLLTMPQGKKGQLAITRPESPFETGFEILKKEEPMTSIATKESTKTQQSTMSIAQRQQLIGINELLMGGLKESRTKLMGESRISLMPSIKTFEMTKTQPMIGVMELTKTQQIVGNQELVKIQPMIGVMELTKTQVGVNELTKPQSITGNQVTGLFIPPIIPPFAFPSFEGGGGGYSRKADKLVMSRKMAYTPNVAGLLSGKTISAKKAKKGAFSGFEIRMPVRGARGGMLWLS